MKKYSIIYADPPWRYERNGVQGAAEKHYPTMSIDELCRLPVSELSEKDSILFLWTTFPQQREAPRPCLVGLLTVPPQRADNELVNTV